MTTMEYKYLIVTSLKLTTEGGVTWPPEDYAEVHFTSNSRNGESAFFLNNIRGKRRWWDGTWRYTANIVSLARASEIAADGFDDEDERETTPLFCIHGHSEQIHEILDSIKIKRDEFQVAGNYYPVPVIWPARRPILDYFVDLRSSREAGDMFRILGDQQDNLFLGKSLMMHSMGNFLVHSNTPGDEGNDGENQLWLYFDNIFMVAADIPADIFSNEPADPGDLEKATIWKWMLGGNGGKIFVFHNEGDLALIHSPLANGLAQRLGWHGTTGDIRDDLEDIVETVNATGEVDDTDTMVHHSYQYDNWTIRQYTALAAAAAAAAAEAEAEAEAEA